MKAYLEKLEKEWYDDFVYISRYPLFEMGFEIIPFDSIEFCEGRKKFNFDKKDVLIGTVESTSLFFNYFGIKTPEYIGYPSELSRFYGRDISLITVKDLDHNFPYFIKPAKEVKLFTGDVIENEGLLNIFKNFYEVPEDCLLYKSPKINIISEWRCFIHRNELKGIQYYKGDFRVYPDSSIIDEVINIYENDKVAYTIDIGVTDKGSTIIVELNDMWAIGSYGLNGKIYSKMCVDRIRQILS